jgi:hypothetical protein
VFFDKSPDYFDWEIGAATPNLVHAIGVKVNASQQIFLYGTHRLDGPRSSAVFGNTKLMDYTLNITEIKLDLSKNAEVVCVIFVSDIPGTGSIASVACMNITDWDNSNFALVHSFLDGSYITDFGIKVADNGKMVCAWINRQRNSSILCNEPFNPAFAAHFDTFNVTSLPQIEILIDENGITTFVALLSYQIDGDSYSSFVSGRSTRPGAVSSSTSQFRSKSITSSSLAISPLGR